MMRDALKVLNKLEQDGVFQRYAIGGAMAAMFYVEPVSTYDLAVFVILPLHGGLLTLSPLYASLHQLGYSEKTECVEIEGVPVQFLPAYNKMLEEALAEARSMMYDGISTRVLTVEYLIAICLQTGRAKDRDRVRLFREEAAIDYAALDAILKRHGLEEKWRQWTNL